jgi:hypothetical protein
MEFISQYLETLATLIAGLVAVFLFYWKRDKLKKIAKL